MENELIDGIVSAIYDEFEFSGENAPNKYTYYKNNVEQGLVRPSFYPTAVSPTFKLLNNNRYQLTCPCVIHYFPQKIGDKGEIYDVGARLMQCLEVVPVGNDLVRGINMSYEIEDDTLLFYVTYNYIVIKQVDVAETMNSEEFNGGAKN